MKRQLAIEGMTCHHCVMAVKDELEKIPHLQVRNVDIGSASIEYDESQVSDEAIVEAIEEAGYFLV